MGMRIALKPLEQQVLVITGATSGIGLATARLAHARGARVVLNSRSVDALRDLERELGGPACRAVAVPGDVASMDDMNRLADEAIKHFFGFDTWVNNAGVGIYGRIDEVPLEEQRRLFDTNYWGVVHGSLAAVRHLRTRGGALVNVGSTLSDRAVPLQGIYSASKHAIKGFTDALRMELEVEGAPVSVTLVKPGGIDTPYPEHARNHLESFPKLPAPVYAPEVVARTILHAAEHPVRDVFVGVGGKLLSLLGNVMPRTMDRLLERILPSAQQSGRPRHGREGLYEPSSSLEERGEYAIRDGGYVARSSLYTAATLRPWLSAAIVAGVGLAAVVGRRALARRNP
jgi:short-subunit dehydrogenase